MAYLPSTNDYELLDQPAIHLFVRIEIKNDNGTISDVLEGVIAGGSLSIDPSSDIRRTTSISLVPVVDGVTLWNGLNKNRQFDLSEKSIIWLNKQATLYCGIEALHEVGHINPSEIPTKIETLTGANVVASDAMKTDATELVLNFEPTQNLNGYSKPWAGGMGKNLLPFGDITNECVDSNGDVIFIDYSLPAGTYYFSGIPVDGYSQITLKQSDDTLATARINNVFTISNDVVSVSWPYQITRNIQLEAGTEKTDFEPYSNVCPVGGYSSFTVKQKGDSGFEKTIPISINADDDTVYKGTLNVTTGTLTITHRSYLLNRDRSITSVQSYPSKHKIKAWMYMQRTSTEPVWADIRENIDFYCDTFKSECVIGGRSLVSSDPVWYDGEVGTISNSKNYPNSFFYYLPYQTVNGVKEATVESVAEWFEENPVTFVFPIQTPLTYQLTPIQVAMFLGGNQFSMNANGTITLSYEAKDLTGIEILQPGDIKWYQMGVFYFTDYSITYDAVTNQMTVNCADLAVMLDGTLNGQTGQYEIEIPAYSEDPETGEPIEFNIIREAMGRVLSQIGGVDNYIISDIGEFRGMPQYNEHYEDYRETHPYWNTVPYDLEFSTGATCLEMVDKLRDLYPNYESFFDENGVFRCQMIPSGLNDNFYLQNDIIQKYLISENTSRDLRPVRNVIEVWGQTIETENYTEETVNENGVYVVNDIAGIEEKYMSGDRIAMLIPSTNAAGQKININGLGDVDIYDEDEDVPLAEGTLEPGKIYVFQLKRLYTSKGQDNELKAYLLGQYQVHAMCVLTDGTVVKDGWTDPETLEKYDLYSKEYYQRKHNCPNVELYIVPESPFIVQKIGERRIVQTGGDYENLTSDSLAIARAHYDCWTLARLTDTIEIQTLIMPFADTNVKVSYQPFNDTEIRQYIVKNVSHDFDAGTTTWTLMSFYPLYEDPLYD